MFKVSNNLNPNPAGYAADIQYPAGYAADIQYPAGYAADIQYPAVTNICQKLSPEFKQIIGIR